jgi:hypothetical protein
MPKFQNLNDAFWYIRDNPLEYFPEKSLELFSAFWIGYGWRFEVEFKEYRGFDLLDGFHDFMCEKFRAPSNHGSFGIAEFYSQNQAEAFDLWFNCLEEFISQNDGTSEMEKYYSERRGAEELNFSRKEADFFTMLQTLLKRPQMYVGSNSFTLVTSLISGWLRAMEDFDFEESAQEKTFEKFQKYIENRPFKIRANEYSDLPPTPSWNKIICFRSHTEENALEMFSEYLDEYAFQGKGFIENVEFQWKNHLEHQKDCHIIKRWKK